MGKMSRTKGAVGEREFAAWLTTELGATAARGCQRKGSKDSPDVLHDIKGIHFEVKRVEALRLYEALKQATEDCEDNCPVVAHRKNKQDWVLILRAQDVARFARSFYEFNQRVAAEKIVPD